MTMRVVVYEPGKKPEVREIASTLEAWQAVVGGTVQEVPIGGGFYIYCNDDGISLGLPFNRMVQGHHILGTFYVAKDKPRTGTIVGLSDEDVPRVLRLIGETP